MIYAARTLVLATVQREHDFGILGSPFSSRYLFKSSMISLPSGEQSLRGTLEPALKLGYVFFLNICLMSTNLIQSNKGSPRERKHKKMQNAGKVLKWILTIT